MEKRKSVKFVASVDGLEGRQLQAAIGVESLALLNPQPLPPVHIFQLNPQPLPPHSPPPRF